ncbi:carbonic anhydrase family protein [Haloferula rosea]|uniref:Carbonic anhydrase n=1 Tax=Haloferula rosea TaxID=490093 RepID=A0A934RE64_9BACT|nr:carbonic anhydrase family protein [Haloferula rosea]MBK1826770.1 carbonic anhydrase [Haloferula rosea]
MKPTLIHSVVIASLGLAAPLALGESMPPTAEEQKALTPKAVLDDLMAGNARYVAETPEASDVSDRIDAGTKGQWPMAYVLSCVDSRVPVEQVFDQGIGDVFVGRVAGNIESTEQLGSMEFATAAAGSKLIFVLGHEACGAVKGACDGVKLGNLTDLLAEIQPAVDGVTGVEGDRSSKNKEFVDAVIEKNVQKTIADIRERSEVIADLEKKGSVMIVGGIYSLETGKVTLLESDK